MSISEWTVLYSRKHLREKTFANNTLKGVYTVEPPIKDTLFLRHLKDKITFLYFHCVFTTSEKRTPPINLLVQRSPLYRGSTVFTNA